MAGKPTVKMSREQRAKQFMPFAALKGFPEALEEKERSVMSKDEYLKKISPDDILDAEQGC